MVEQLPQMRQHRSKQKNILKIGKVMAWIEASNSELLWIDGNNMIRRHDFTRLLRSYFSFSEKATPEAT